MKKQNYVLHILVLLACCIFDMALSVKLKWTLKTTPLVLGEDVQLFCSTSSENCHGCHLTWGRGSDIIIHNENSYEPEKFIPKEGGFLLKIKKLSKIDLQYNYTCSFGHETYTDNLLSSIEDNNQIICFPKKNETSTSVNINNTRRAIEANVTLKEVSPPPICKVSINGEDASRNLTRQIKECTPLYNATYELEYNLKESSCQDNLQVEMNCLFSNKKIVILNETLKLNCSGMSENNEEKKISFIVPVLSLMLALLALLAMIVIFLKKRKLQLCLHEPDNIGVNENEDERFIII